MSVKYLQEANPNLDTATSLCSGNPSVSHQTAKHSGPKTTYVPVPLPKSSLGAKYSAGKDNITTNNQNDAATSQSEISSTSFSNTYRRSSSPVPNRQQLETRPTVNIEPSKQQDSVVQSQLQDQTQRPNQQISQEGGDLNFQFIQVDPLAHKAPGTTKQCTTNNQNFRQRSLLQNRDLFGVLNQTVYQSKTQEQPQEIGSLALRLQERKIRTMPRRIDNPFH